MKNGQTICIKKELEEVRAMENFCPRQNGGNDFCFFIHCKNHSIHQVLTDQVMEQKSDEEILEVLFILKETCLLSSCRDFYLRQVGFDCSYNVYEIAQRLGIATEIIKQTIEKALRKLRYRAKIAALAEFLPNWDYDSRNKPKKKVS